MHVVIVLRDLGLRKSTLVVTPVVKRPKSEELLLLAGAKPLNAQDTTLHRSVMVRVNHLFLDRPVLSFAAGSLARGMKSPSRNLKCWAPLARGTSRSDRFLNHTHGLEFWRWSAMQTILETWEHASPSLEWQSCGGHLIKHGSALHSTIASSGGESGHCLLGKDWRKTGHVDVRFLWLQQAAQEGRLKVLSVPTSQNLSDTVTKSLSQADGMNFHMGSVGSCRHRKLGNTLIPRIRSPSLKRCEWIFGSIQTHHEFESDADHRKRLCSNPTLLNSM